MNRLSLPRADLRLRATRVALLLLALATAALSAPRAVWADEATAETKAQAGKAFERGMKYYQKEEYAKAIELFETGYGLIPQPVFLYNIAQAHRLAEQPEKALTMYRRYLRESPTAQNRAEVEERITALEQQLGPAFYSSLYVPPNAESLSEPPPAALLGDGKIDPIKKAGRSRTLPIVLGVVGGVVVVGVAVGLGVYFGTRGSQASVFEPVTP